MEQKEPRGKRSRAKQRHEQQACEQSVAPQRAQGDAGGEGQPQGGAHEAAQDRRPVHAEAVARQSAVVQGRPRRRAVGGKTLNPQHQSPIP